MTFSCVDRFLKYVQIDTQSNPESESVPSTAGQWNLAKLLQQELTLLGLETELTEKGYLYAFLKGNSEKGTSLTFCAHMDTSDAVSGKEVKPRIIKAYDGSPISFPLDSQITLTQEECPELALHKGHDLIVASGDTLLGADNKAGIAEIMAALEYFKQNPQFPRPSLHLVFTPDEEIGRGADFIELSKLGKVAYTVDADILGTIEGECFDAWKAKLTFHGVNIHPGYAKNKMINAIAIASRLVSLLPEKETPEHTSHKEGFFHLASLSGDESLAQATFILRDFQKEGNARRMEILKNLISFLELKYPGLKIDLDLKHQYENMYEEIQKHPHVWEALVASLEKAHILAIVRPIRGGTDGARFTAMGLPTPNIFTGGAEFHSKKEWVSIQGMEKAVEVILNLTEYWASHSL